MSRYAKLELETSAGNGSTTAGVFATPFYLPATAVALNPGPKPLDRSDEIRGIDGRTPLAPNDFEPSGEIELRGYASYLGALLYLLWGDVVTTAGDGIITDPDGNTIPAGAYRHVFSKLSGATPKTAMLTQSYGSQFVQARGLSLSEMAFAIEEDGVKAKCTAMANYLNRLTSDPLDTPSYEDFSILPWRRRNVDLEVDNGATIKTESFEFTLEQSLEYVWDLGNIANAGFPTATERANSVEGFLSLSGKLKRRDFDSADWEALIAATEFDLRVLMESEQNIGATAYPYRLWVEAGSCQFAGGELEGQKNQPRHEFDLDWVAGYNEDDGYDCKVTIVNGTAAYE